MSVLKKPAHLVSIKNILSFRDNQLKNSKKRESDSGFALAGLLFVTKSKIWTKREYVPYEATRRFPGQYLIVM